MARLEALPSLDIISGFRGLIDYYIYYPSCPVETGVKGTPCARRWPRSPGHRRAPAVEAAWVAFSYIAKQWNTLDHEIQQAYNKQASSTGLNGRDLFERAYLTGLYTYPTGSS